MKSKLPESEILAILRAADEMIAEGGRTLLAKTLKGSREKKVLELGLDECPTYGDFKSEKLETVMEKIDWMIDNDFLDIQYNGKLPMIVYTERGWDIEKNQRVDEFLCEWDQWIAKGRIDQDMTYLKDRNRGMILLLLERIRETGNKKYIPLLERWESVDYKKVRAAIRETIKAIETGERVDEQRITEREQLLHEALEGSPPEDLVLKCWDCGDRFTFSVGEQRFFKQKGFTLPKRCEECRMERKFGWDC
ncbi:zinc-ribbon domain containing protein [Aquibacillus sp. 3ASR75-11]|uniref:Zinc-ribbon domain containing protein n=1 Tax=Terrihalobacillus insolitus TaxID=2950438 RepID=A0A9X4AKF1_9BACI|nr:RQC-minor-1 family DNA-binding protein [Terrihalobacillus insolitus]MDC3412075.1 zinc-ribbon domain containing protein [Terrihalobacillus insolitus]MDC3423232.1 zinc-ribbon domain containing protein [Terrihalobacillus insolitus]